MVYTLAFSPDADLVASGATDRCVHIWSVKDGSLVRTYTASAGIFDLSFNSTGTKLAAACGDSAVAIIDMRK
jgi:transducin (beta)-like 1